MVSFSQVVFFSCFILILFGSPKKFLKSVGFGFSFVLKLLFSKMRLFMYL
jgi:hypothetical protein